MGEQKVVGLYLHIPFCKSKCLYCDFNSYPQKESFMPEYFQALKKELAYYQAKYPEYRIGTVFIGGGTPSLAEPKEIYGMLNLVKTGWRLATDVEITIETNPGTLSYEKLMAYKAMGINRLSIGLQAAQNHLLQKLGRIHTFEEFQENYEQARKVGFRNINVDLIFGLPGQTLRDWEQTLQKVTALKPEHLSCYSLKVEEGTALERCLEAGELQPVEEELDREMYYRCMELLDSLGIKHYEISNFARPGYACRHNLVYWHEEEYLGCGAGAHSYLEGKRFNNVSSIETYIANDFTRNAPVENIIPISLEEQMGEFVILGLRCIAGISGAEFRARFQEDLFLRYAGPIEKLVRKNLLELHGDILRLTRQGLDFANEVFMEFI